MGLVAIIKCPVCGCSERLPARDGIASRRRDTGRYYLEHAARRLSVTVDQALDAINVFQCRNCKSYYCDPWLPPEVSVKIFTVDAPDHLAGWGNFEHWLSSPCPNAVESANYQLYQALLKYLGKITSYAEYGCPFQGFLLLFGRLESTPRQRVNVFSQAISRRSDIRWTIGPLLHHYAQKLAHRLAVTYHQLRVLRRGDQPQPRVVLKLPEIRQMLIEGNTTAWGNNCVRYSASCSYYASKLLGADVLPVKERLSKVERQPEFLVDLLGIFNFLDHTDHPMTVIRDALKLAHHVIVVTHHAAVAGKQHLLAFHESFPRWLESTLVDVRVTDLTAEMSASGHRDYAYVLISRASTRLAAEVADQL